MPDMTYFSWSSEQLYGKVKRSLKSLPPELVAAAMDEFILHWEAPDFDDEDDDFPPKPKKKK